jgi:hypothetical protein
MGHSTLLLPVPILDSEDGKNSLIVLETEEESKEIRESIDRGAPIGEVSWQASTASECIGN